MIIESTGEWSLPFLRYKSFWAVLATGLLLSGCSRYSAIPLQPEQVWTRIESLRLDDLAKTPPGRPSSTDVPTEFDYTDGLSVDEAAGLAVVLNPDLRALRLEKGIAQAQLVEAGLLSNPEIDSNWLTPPVTPLQWAGEANALFNLSEALLVRRPRRERARIRIEEVKWEIADREWRLAIETRQAFWDAIYWEEALKLSHKQREFAERTVAVLRARKARGAGSELDVLVAETQRGNLERQAKRVAGEGKEALQSLNRLLGLPPNHTTQLQVPDNPLAFSSWTADRDLLAEHLRRNRPDLLAAEQAYLGVEKDLHLAHRKQFPRIAIGPSYSGGDGEKNGALGLGFTLDLPLFNRNQGEIALKISEREQRRLLYEAKLQAARGEFYSAWTKLETLDGELKTFFSDIAPKLDRSLELTQAAFGKGELDILQVVLVQERALETQREILERLREFKRAQVEFDRSCGPKLVTPEQK